MGNIKLDFALILVVLTALTGVIWAIDHWLFAKARAARQGEAAREPLLVEYSRSFFPVIFIVLIIRSFIAEPFRIPSSSMMPTLLIDDFILDSTSSPTASASRSSTRKSSPSANRSVAMSSCSSIARAQCHPRRTFAGADPRVRPVRAAAPDGALPDAGLRCAGRRLQRRALWQGRHAATRKAGGRGDAGLLGHPLSQLYVAKYMTPESRREVKAMVARVKAQFHARIARNGWLSPPTRAQALAKLDKTEIRVGYPSKWIDYAGVDVRRDDYAGNAMRLNEFLVRRELAKLGKPVELDQFAVPKQTLPIVINAGYDPSWYGIEIPAAFLQPPFYDAKADPAVNYCTMGAVIGHELTHGFDSSGRLYDAQGNVPDWWTAADAQRFVAETAKLAKEADAFEILPGLRLNGALEVTENLADVGGVALGYAAGLNVSKYTLT